MQPTAAAAAGTSALAGGAPLGAAQLQLGNAALLPEVAASLIQQAAAEAAPCELAGVVPPALFLGSNQGNNRLAYGDLCELFVGQGHYSVFAGKHCIVFAFRDAADAQLAERLPAAERGRWAGSFGGRPTAAFTQQFGFVKNSTSFKRKDGSFKVRCAVLCYTWCCCGSGAV